MLTLFLYHNRATRLARRWAVRPWQTANKVFKALIVFLSYVSCLQLKKNVASGVDLKRKGTQAVLEGFLATGERWGKGQLLRSFWFRTGGKRPANQKSCTFGAFQQSPLKCFGTTIPFTYCTEIGKTMRNREFPTKYLHTNICISKYNETAFVITPQSPHP